MQRLLTIFFFFSFKTPSEMPRLRIVKDPHATSPPETRTRQSKELCIAPNVTILLLLLLLLLLLSSSSIPLFPHSLCPPNVNVLRLMLHFLFSTNLHVLVRCDPYIVQAKTLQANALVQI